MSAPVAIPTRHHLRAAADAAGVASAFGGPLPHGRRIELVARAGRIVADSDRSARWRGRVLFEESPASLSAAARDGLRRVALAVLERLGLADARLEFVVGDGEPVLIDIAESSDDAGHDADDGAAVTISATVRAGEPSAPTATVVGRCTALDLPPGARTALALGAVLRCAPGDELASFAVRGADRATAVGELRRALAALRLDGIASDLALLRAVADSDALAHGLASARAVDALPYAPPAIAVLAPGTHTTVQDFPGRLGRWQVGVPPSGAMDDLALRLANRLVGNPAGTAALESTLVGPTLRFLAPAIVCLAGCPLAATVDGAPLAMWRAVAVPAGAVVRLGAPVGAGCRATLAVRGGIAVPEYLGSRATFDLGGFGGHAGRRLEAGDVVPLARACAADELAACPPPLATAARPGYTRAWEIGVLEGPHAAPDFFTGADLRELYATAYTVHHNSNRTGVRLIGPKPRWARADGGEAGLHPSNIHDNAYAVGAIDFTGDMPILLGPDGPSCGGFVCPAVTVAAERWKLGQLRPGDRVRFVRLTPASAERRARAQARLVADLVHAPPASTRRPDDDVGEAVVWKRAARGAAPALTLRRAGDEYLLAEYGAPVLDLALRLRAHQLMAALEARRLDGIIDVTPGIRSLQVHHDPARLPQARLALVLRELDETLAPLDDVVLPSRVVHLPLSWDDPSTREAIRIYLRSVNPTAPWCPSNLEFIRRINGLDSLDEVRRIVFDAEYLVLGLGDVYLGAPVATPIDPRHRLVTTKYNPARTWTPENAVGIGGAYLCVYGMEGPGGYQFVGRTVPVWNSWRTTDAFPAGQPWLLRFFDRIRFHPVAAEDLPRLRAGTLDGSTSPRIEPGEFRWRDHQRFLAEHDASIAAFRATQRAAFAAERGRWEATARATQPAVVARGGGAR